MALTESGDTKIDQISPIKFFVSEQNRKSWVLGYIVPEREEDHYQIRQQT